MADELDVSLRLEFDDAISAAQAALDDAFARSAEAFGEQTADALTSALDSIDAGSIDIPVDADTADAVASVEDFAALAEAFDPTVGVDAETAAAEAALDDFAALADATDPEATLTLDTSEAEASLESVSASAEEAAGSFDLAGAGASGLQAASGLATGSVGALGGAVGGLSDEMGAAVGVIGAGAAATGVFFNEALDAESVSIRWRNTLGDLADQVDNINVGDLNTDISSLAIQLGSSDEAMRRAALNTFLFATNSGLAEDQAANLSETILGLAARAVALNPDLGDVGDAAQTLFRGLITGRERALVPFNLGLDKTAVAAKAQELALAAGRTEVTGIDKAMAGAALAAPKLANAQQLIADASENPTIRLRSLRTELGEYIEELGTPLIAPVFDLLDAGVPVAEAAGTAIAELAQAALPLLVAGAEIAAPLLRLLATALEAIPDPVLSGVIAFMALERALFALAARFPALALAIETNPLVAFVTVLGVAAAAIGFFGGETDDATVEVDQFTSALIDAGTALDGTALEALRAKLEQAGYLDELARGKVELADVASALDDVAGSTKAQRDAVEDALNAWNNGTVGATGFYNALRDASPATADLFLQMQRLGGYTFAYTADILGPAIQSTLDAASATDARAGAGATDADITGQQADAYAAAQDAAKGFADELDRIAGTHLSVFAAQAALAESTANLGAALFENTATFDVNSEAGRANIQALIGATRGAQDLASAQVGLTGNTADGENVMRFFTASLVDMLTRAQASPEQINTLLISLGLVPFAAEGASEGVEAADIPGTVGTAMTGAVNAAILGGGQLRSASLTGGQNAGAAIGPGIATTARPGVAGVFYALAATGIPVGALLSAASNAGQAIGTSFTLAIARGIKSVSAVAAVEDAARSVVRAAAAAAANAGSPSVHLFYDEGVRQMEALAAGYGEAGAAAIAEAENVVRAAAGVSPVSGAPLPLTAAGLSGTGGGDTYITFDVAVHGVTDTNTARAVGAAVVRGASDELDGAGRRRIMVRARTG